MVFLHRPRSGKKHYSQRKDLRGELVISAQNTCAGEDWSALARKLSCHHLVWVFGNNVEWIFLKVHRLLLPKKNMKRYTWVLGKHGPMGLETQRHQEQFAFKNQVTAMDYKHKCNSRTKCLVPQITLSIPNMLTK